MKIICTNCGTSYQVEASSLGPTGRSVRCVRCRHTWFAANTEALGAIAEHHRADVAALTGAPLDAAGADASPPAQQPIPERSAPAAVAPSGPGDPNGTAAASQADPVAPPAEMLPPLPEPLVEAPPLAPIDVSPIPTPAQAAEPEDIETVAARRTGRKAGKRTGLRRPRLTTAILALIAINMALVGWRADVVRALPQTASLYAAIGLPVNLRGLAFKDVATEQETHEGVPVLVVGGMILNTAKRPVDVPRLRFAVRGGSGQEIYSWTALPTKATLVPGEMLEFRSRLASPPAGASQVLVRFFNRRDLIAGMQ